MRSRSTTSRAEDRGVKATAIEAATYLKTRGPHADVVVRDGESPRRRVLLVEAIARRIID
jgi:hypothetical protein